MGAMDRISEVVRDVRERVDEMKDQLLGPAKESKEGKEQGGGEGRQQSKGQGGGGLGGIRDRAAGVVEEAMVAGTRMSEAIRGEPDVLDVLKKDHEMVKGLFDQLDALKESGRSEKDLREGLFAQLKYELETHAAVEEKLFYPRLRRQDGGRDLVAEAFQEHQVVKDLLRQLDSMTLGGEEWQAKLTVLKENVLHHVKEEEDGLFPIAKEHLDKEQLRQLGLRLEQEKQALANAGKPDDAQPGQAEQGQGGQRNHRNARS